MGDDTKGLAKVELYKPVNIGEGRSYIVNSICVADVTGEYPHLKEDDLTDEVMGRIADAMSDGLGDCYWVALEGAIEKLEL